jgi:crotonobetainyl-CoA:carnitine CoA-transferase CaiB-like acyl-CoA transferase
VEQAALPMHGLRVVDFSIMVAGPFCTRLMADLGAEVIKVEPPEGDPMRAARPERAGHSAYYAHLNAGKRSVVLDLKAPADRDAALALATHADVVLQAFRPGVMERLGLGYAAVSARNPRVVYASVSGYGQSGPLADRPAFAPMIQATSGMELAIMGHLGADRPPPVGIFSADVMTSLFTLIGVQAALAARAATGQGTHVDATLLETMHHLLPYEIQEAQFPLAEPRPNYTPVRTRDGFVMVVIVTPANFQHLCRLIERPDLLTDVRFATSPERRAHLDQLMGEVDRWTRERSTAECETSMAAAGVPCARYRTVAENLDDATAQHRASFAAVRDGAGSTLVPNLPFLFGERRLQVRPDVALLGADTQAVLRELQADGAARGDAANGT